MRTIIYDPFELDLTWVESFRCIYHFSPPPTMLAKSCHIRSLKICVVMNPESYSTYSRNSLTPKKFCWSLKWNLFCHGLAYQLIFFFSNKCLSCQASYGVLPSRSDSWAFVLSITTRYSITGMGACCSKPFAVPAPQLFTRTPQPRRKSSTLFLF
jgi:hypothetical protein